MTAGMKAMQEKKKGSSGGAAKQDAKVGAGTPFSFFGDIKAEFRKVTWTSKDELIAYTKIVIIATSLMGIGIFFADMMIQAVLSGLSEIVRWIVG